MTIHTMLKQHFGYDAFRDGQEALINDILAGKDVLGIMPTGAGKSVCFQIPALLMEGLTIIISPLISLMKDQVTGLIQSGIAAAYINSSLTENQIYKALQNARNNVYKLIYVAPERLLSNDFLDFAKSAKISMLTVDEAHCISHWGHDFRPSYAKIPDFIASLQNRPVVSAFTATATPKVRDDIIELLRLDDPTILGTGFDRPNLYYEIQKPKKKILALLSFLKDKKDRSGIIYCSTRTTVEEVCSSLKENGFNASRYHAGLSDIERHDNQDDFIYDRIQIMVATNAFGMGIDKSNVAYVLHYNMPKDIESYYQEAGRSGRDGEPADCVLFYSGQDVRTNLWLIENARESKEPDDELLREQVIERDRARLRDVTFYCTTNDCLRGFILKYFGENPPVYCGSCGNCDTNFETVDITVVAQKILSCVVRMKERYGLNMVIDTLRGSKSEKIVRFGLNKLSTYDICKESSRQLRLIMQHLLLSGYLLKTDGEYPIIKLGERANEILHEGAVVHMKLPREKEPAAKPEAQARGMRSGRQAQGTQSVEQAQGMRSGEQAQGMQSDRQVQVKRSDKQTQARPPDKRLFAALRDVRLSIANEQNLPAFVIFHNSTLTDMCIKMPTTMETLMDVSGVGKVKAERYGKRFLDAINAFLRDDDSVETLE